METKKEGLKYDTGKLRYDLLPKEWFKYANEYENRTFHDYCDFDLTFVEDLKLSEERQIVFNSCAFICGSLRNLEREVVRVYTFGAERHGDWNWQNVDKGLIRFGNAVFRHIDAFKRGNYINPDDGNVLHVAQIAWNIVAYEFFYQQALEHNKDVDFTINPIH